MFSGANQGLVARGAWLLMLVPGRKGGELGHVTGRAKQGLVACDERGLPGMAKHRLSARRKDSESTERFARRLHGRI